MAKFSIKKDDFVMIIAGKDKGKTAQVIAINRDNHRALVEGKDLKTVNKKSVKARKASDRGGIIEQPGSIDVSNLMPICSACGKATRVGYEMVDGNKERMCKKCGAVLVTKKSVAKKAAPKKRATKKSQAEDENVATTEAKATVRKRTKAADADNAPAETAEN